MPQCREYILELQIPVHYVIFNNFHDAHYDGDCTACHTAVSWKDIHFDHEGRQATDCFSCHEIKYLPTIFPANVQPAMTPKPGIM